MGAGEIFSHTWNFRLCEIIARSRNNIFFAVWDMFCSFPKITPPKPKTLGGSKKCKFPQKSNKFWKSKSLAYFGRSRCISSEIREWEISSRISVLHPATYAHLWWPSCQGLPASKPRAASGSTGLVPVGWHRHIGSTSLPVSQVLSWLSCRNCRWSALAWYEVKDPGLWWIRWKPMWSTTTLHSLIHSFHV